MTELLECIFAVALFALVCVAWARWGQWIGAGEMNAEHAQQVNYRKQVESGNAFQHGVAEDIARRLFNAGLWNGQGLIVIPEPAASIRRVLRKGIETLVEGVDYTVEVVQVETGSEPDDAPTQPDRPNRRFRWL